MSDEKFTLANKRHLSLFIGILIYKGAMCEKCGHGTRVTSKRWARCKKCNHRNARRELPASPISSQETPK